MFSVFSLQSYVSYRLSIVSLSCILGSKLPIFRPLFSVLCSLPLILLCCLYSVLCPQFTVFCSLSFLLLYPLSFVLLCQLFSVVRCLLFLSSVLCSLSSIFCPPFFVVRLSLSSVPYTPSSVLLFFSSVLFFVVCASSSSVLSPQFLVFCPLFSLMFVLYLLFSITYFYPQLLPSVICTGFFY